MHQLSALVGCGTPLLGIWISRTNSPNIEGFPAGQTEQFATATLSTERHSICTVRRVRYNTAYVMFAVFHASDDPTRKAPPSWKASSWRASASYKAEEKGCRAGISSFSHPLSFILDLHSFRSFCHFTPTIKQPSFFQPFQLLFLARFGDAVFPFYPRGSGKSPFTLRPDHMLYILLVPSFVSANNDWNTPCLQGTCYHTQNSTHHDPSTSASITLVSPLILTNAPFSYSPSQRTAPPTRSPT